MKQISRQFPPCSIETSSNINIKLTDLIYFVNMEKRNSFANFLHIPTCANVLSHGAALIFKNSFLKIILIKPIPHKNNSKTKKRGSR